MSKIVNQHQLRLSPFYSVRIHFRANLTLQVDLLRCNARQSVKQLLHFRPPVRFDPTNCDIHTLSQSLPGRL